MKPTIYTSDSHTIKEGQIDPDALRILQTLQRAGYIAYLVGGGVRDLLAKKKPKDFDISTSARPEEVKKLFKRNCLLIGKRFRLAHIRYGRKIFEISTFRSGDNTNESLLITRDNIWGTPEEDVLRRDFTINGLFYDPFSSELIDYVGGANDLQKQLLRSIGDPKTRFVQDPVRMVRLLKFRARFGFHIDPPTMTALTECREEILKSAPARVLEETLRMLESGFACSFFTLMQEVGLWSLLYPKLSKSFRSSHKGVIFSLLQAADETHLTPRSTLIDRAVLLSCFVFPMLDQKIQALHLEDSMPAHMGDVLDLTHSVLKEYLFQAFPRITKRQHALMTYTLSTQYRLITLPTTKNFRRSRLLRSPDFPLALGLLRLRSKVQPKLRQTYEDWKELYKQSLPTKRTVRRHHTRQHPHSH